MSRKDKIILVLSIILLLCGIACIAYVISYYIEGIELKNENEKLANIFYNSMIEDANSSGSRSENDSAGKAENEALNADEINRASIINGILELKQTNNDVVGWIRVDNTDIDYPVVQSEDNEYYLTHDLYGEYSKRGCIFLDFRNDIASTSEAIAVDPQTTTPQTYILYGHNMKDRTMFGSLRNYLDDGYLDTHSVVHFYTLEGEMLFELDSIATVNVTKTGYEKYYNTKADNEGIVLSTCSTQGNRFIVSGSRRK